MVKTRRTITALLPGYERNRYRWRRRILANVLRAGSETGVKYATKDTFEVVVLLYLKKGKRYDIHDVDNRLKDILDALQGRFGGSKTIKSKSRLIQNDRQVCRVVIEKQKFLSHWAMMLAEGFLSVRTSATGGRCRGARAINF